MRFHSLFFATAIFTLLVSGCAAVQPVADAQALGREIVRQEQALSDAFAAGTIDPIALNTQVSLLGDDYGQLRNIHLQAHLQVTPLLTDEQIALYDVLRGYNDAMHDVHSH